MSDRPTPETDATAEKNIYGVACKVDVDFARKLERERDEAREAAAMWESSSDAMERAGAEQARRADENREWALKAERERDEAREAAYELAKQAERLRKERDQLKEALLIMENLLKPGIELFPEIGEILKQGGAK